MKTTLIEIDYLNAAEKIGCSVAAIKAVCQVEAPKGGFNLDGTPVTLFERHKFFKFTSGRFALSHPNLCNPKWDKSAYGRNWLEEQARLKTAQSLDYKAACMSASWGKFQIMGFNYGAAGFPSIMDFINAMSASESAHLEAFVNIIDDWGLADEMQRQDWAGFARVYNGPAYRENKYDTKLAAAYDVFSTV